MPATSRIQLSSRSRPKLDANMFKLVVFCALASVTAAQYYKNSREAAILTDARYLSGNGQFGSSYKQEDGIDFKEETDAAGNRVGSYSYVDPSGQKRTISYTAGKDGFRATGDGVPVAPAPVAPLPQYNPPPSSWNQNQNQYSAPAVTERNWDESSNNKWDQWDDPGTWNSPTSAPAAQNWNQQPQQPQQSQWTSQAQAQPQPQWNPQAQTQTWSAPAQPQQNWNQASQYDPTTTPAPHRFYPPGKLSLNRSPDGFSYTFNKN